jgi:FKBP-type peptidyl-prolyl cis-trans isomerase
MKLITSITASCIALGFSVSALAQTPAAEAVPAAAPAPAFTEPQMLEMFGWLMASRFGLTELELTTAEVDYVSKGLYSAAAGKPSPGELGQIGPEMQKFLQAKNAIYRAKASEKSKAEAENFFAEVKAKPGVQVTPSGLCYEVVQPGSGEFPKASDTVRVHYTGTLVNGTKFDSSVDRGEPSEFPLSGVIAAWTEGLQKINKGGKLKLYVPSNLGYGEQGTQGIPPNATLIFDVELIDILTPATGETK